jgi:hypothetical protein
VEETMSQRLLHYATKKLGMREVAARLKVEEQTLNRWLGGETQVPSGRLGELADLIDSIGKHG